MPLHYNQVIADETNTLNVAKHGINSTDNGGINLFGCPTRVAATILVCNKGTYFGAHIAMPLDLIVQLLLLSQRPITTYRYMANGV